MSVLFEMILFSSVSFLLDLHYDSVGAFHVILISFLYCWNRLSYYMYFIFISRMVRFRMESSTERLFLGATYWPEYGDILWIVDTFYPWTYWIVVYLVFSTLFNCFIFNISFEWCYIKLDRAITKLFLYHLSSANYKFCISTLIYAYHFGITGNLTVC